MEQQHRTMIAAIQRGRFDGPDGAVQVPDGMSAPEAPPASSRPTPAASPPAQAPAKPAKTDKTEKPARPSKGDKSPDATASAGARIPFPESDRSLDQMVLEYLGSDEVPDEVDLALTPTPDFVSGRSVQTRLKATSGSPPRPLAGASVQVRILSTSARASTAFEGRTAADGSCSVSFMVPAFPNGTAAAVIRVTGPKASTEVQYPIKRK
jgi:hypothetical protein